MLDATVDTWTDVWIRSIRLKLCVEVILAMGVLAEVCAGGTVGIGVEMNAWGLISEMTVLEFEFLLPFEKLFLSCWASCMWWSMTVLDCDCSLQACKPSCQV